MSLLSRFISGQPLAGVLVVTLLLLGPRCATAQSVDTNNIDDPAPPTDGSNINQAGEQGATLRAVRVNEPLRIDGVIDEAFYQNTAPISHFIQSVPEEFGDPSQLTEAWIGFDDQNVYVSAKVWDTEGPDGWIANEMRRDGPQARNNDNFGVFLDTFYDRRNAVGFYGNAIGGISDFQITNEGSVNRDWNPIVESHTALFDGGWSIEFAIPFKSLRYRPGTEQTWGIQLRRTVIRRNEWNYIRAIPLSVAGTGAPGGARVSLYATLVGIEAPPPSRSVEVKPYVISGFRTDLSADPQLSNVGYADAGLDIKYGITENLTADFTVNTDFAQVEVDEQQVNLTRFSLSFPEKREFFLESQGLFSFGAGAVGGGGGARGAGRGGGAPQLFYSRRIGLQDGVAVPILGGGRVTGKVGAFELGLVSIQTGDAPVVGAESTNYSVVRLRRGIFNRSSLGMLLENRSRSSSSTGSNRAWGFDGLFGLSDDASLLAYYSKTKTQGLNGLDASYRGQFSYNGDRWGASINHLVVGNNFNPEIGFVRRKDFRQNSLSGRFSPRPRSVSWIRQLTFQLNAGFLENEQTGVLESRNWGGQFRTSLENSDQFNVTYTNNYENLFEDTRISSATIPAGEYSFPDLRVSYTMGPQRPYSGNFSVRRGKFYEGNLTSVGLGRGRIEVSNQLSLEPSVSFNWIDLPQGQFNQHVASTQVIYTLTPRAYVTSLVQYNSRSNTFSGNFRLRWEWAPGSELFLVYTEDRDTDVLDRWSDLRNRGFVIKVNRLLRM
jgi:hypothetical protein